jgi:hypothetical protein
MKDCSGPEIVLIPCRCQKWTAILHRLCGFSFNAIGVAEFRGAAGESPEVEIGPVQAERQY